MDALRMQTNSTLHPHHILPDNFFFFCTNMATAVQSSCDVGNTFPHNLRSCTVHVDNINFLICPDIAHRLL